MSSTATRTDVHRIAALDPADYVLAAFEDRHEDDGYFEWYAPPLPTAGYFPFRGNFGVDADETDKALTDLHDRLAIDHAYGCAICGQSHGNRYWHFFMHEPTGDVIRVGSRCAEKVGLGSREELEDWRARESRNMARIRGAFLAGRPDARRALDVAMAAIARKGLTLREDGYCFTLTNADGEYHGADFPTEFYVDLTKRFNRYGDMTDKQIALALRLEAERPDRERRDEEFAARKQAEEDAKQPIPADVLDGRNVITGAVLTARWQESTYGGSIKMLVADDRGFKVWGTCPQAVLDQIVDQISEAYENGEYEPGKVPTATEAIKSRNADGDPYRITFHAAVEASNDDPAFGFVNRPTKAQVI